MASQTWQKWCEFKITYRVSVINVRDWEITIWDWKITVWEIEITIREWKTVMRDHNYQSRTKNYHTRFILTVENEKSLYEKKNHHSRISISFFSEPLSLSSQRRVFWRDYLSSLKWRSNWVAEDFTDWLILEGVLLKEPLQFIVHLIM